jgi:FkbM family methyltransferase
MVPLDSVYNLRVFSDWIKPKMSLSTLRRLRHGPLRRYSLIWTVLGRAYRLAFRAFGLRRTVETRIGPYGPFRLDGIFAFSNFENWGNAHNNGFKLCIETCRGKRCVIDIGAHIGLVALPAASVIAPEGRVICFEPARANRDLLVKHAAHNGLSNIVVQPYLVGKKPLIGVPFFEMNEPTGMNSIAVGRDPQNYHETICEQVSLDSYCNAHALRPEVIKIDVEGAEIGVLQGPRDVIARYHPMIFLSIHPREIVSLGGSVEALADLIKELGYTLREIDGQIPQQLELREYVLT